MLRPLLLSLSAACCATSALAVDWGLSATGSSSLKADTKDGVTLGANAGLSGRARTKTTDWTFGSGVSWNANRNGSSFVWPNFNLSMSHREPRTTYTASIQFSPALARSSFFEPLSRFDAPTPSKPEVDGTLEDGAEVEAIRLPLRINLGLSHRATPRDSFSASVYYRLTEFTKSSKALTPSRGWGGSLGWNHTLREDLSLGLTASASESHSFPRGGETASRDYALTGNVNWSVNQRFSLNASLGPSLVQTLTGPRKGNTELGLSARAGFSYQPRADLSFTGGLSQSFTQDAKGQLVDRLALTSGGSWRINPRESVRLNGSASFSSPVFGEGNSSARYVLSPGYSWSITPEWSVNADYSLTYDADRSDAFSHTATLSVSYNYTLIP